MILESKNGNAYLLMSRNDTFSILHNRLTFIFFFWSFQGDFKMKSKPFYRCLRLQLLIISLAAIIGNYGVFCQSNYASHGNNIEYQGGLPEEATLDGKVSNRNITLIFL